MTACRRHRAWIKILWTERLVWDRPKVRRTWAFLQQELFVRTCLCCALRGESSLNWLQKKLLVSGTKVTVNLSTLGLFAVWLKVCSALLMGNKNVWPQRSQHFSYKASKASWPMTTTWPHFSLFFIIIIPTAAIAVAETLLCIELLVGCFR